MENKAVSFDTTPYPNPAFSYHIYFLNHATSVPPNHHHHSPNLSLDPLVTYAYTFVVLHLFFELLYFLHIVAVISN